MLEFVLAAVLTVPVPPTDAQVRATARPRSQAVTEVGACKRLVGVATVGGAVVCKWQCQVTDVPTVRSCLRFVRTVEVETEWDGRALRVQPRG